ncbi:MAG: DUF1611 domain-containing protein [Acholeplasma sp.]|nr:DUF1611 domain-containing protein [Acholeplasma sp.]
MKKLIVIDTGVSLSVAQKFARFNGLQIKTDIKNKYLINSNIRDNIGHGTAVLDIIASEFNQLDVTLIKIFEDDEQVDISKLFFALDYIYDNLSADVLLISLGIRGCRNLKLFKQKINQIYNKGIIIVSAFDNSGGVSYPAAFDAVIGIDVSSNILKKDDFCVVKNSIVNLIGTNRHYNIMWKDNKKLIVNGASFTAAHLVSKIISVTNEKENTNSQILSKLKQTSNYCTKNYKYNKEVHDVNFVKKIKKAIVFPFNKEIHPLALFQNLIDFDIVDFYDVGFSANVNQKIESFKEDETNRYIKNIKHLNWNSDFDTIILGHCDVLEKIIKRDLKGAILESAMENNKNIYMFDKPSYDELKIYSKESLCYPKVNKYDIDKSYFGKLHVISKPIIGVFGTSSKQGKYTLQLTLRERFKKDFYKVGQIGTEPSGYLFGFDFVLPMGYNSTVSLGGAEITEIVNQQLHQIENSEPDIIIAGAQSLTIPYARNSIYQIPFNQYEFIIGLQPDIVLLCINQFDSIEYIRKTICYIETISSSKVIALVLFPYKIKEKSFNIQLVQVKSSRIEIDEIKSKMYREFKINTYCINYSEDIESMYCQIIDYLS